MATKKDASVLPQIVSSLASRDDKAETDSPPPVDDLPLSNHRHLVLHFDINETLLVGDEAGGDTREDSLNKILAKSAFVKFNPAGGAISNSHTSSFEPTHWWNGDRIESTMSNNESPPPLYTGWQWPADCCPYYRTSFKSRSRNFVQHHGVIYKELYEEMKHLLKSPITDSTDVSSDVITPGILSHMLPAFFETVVALTQSEQRFTLVFRTMGTDLPEIAAAITAFARGQHPNYPDFYNADLILEETKLLQGRWASNNDGQVFQLFSRDGAMVASGDAEILNLMHSETVCGIQDDYSFWKSNGYAPWSGKPVWIPRNNRFQHIIMDDNIHNLPDDSIVSVRIETEDDHQHNFQTLTGPEIMRQQGRHLIRVPTVEPILNPNWFVEQIENAQRNFAYHHSIQQGSL